MADLAFFRNGGSNYWKGVQTFLPSLHIKNIRVVEQFFFNKFADIWIDFHEGFKNPTEEYVVEP